MATIRTLKGTGTFTVGPSGFTGKGKYLVLNAASELEAYTLVAATAPPVLAAPNGIPVLRGDISIEDAGGGVYLADMDYSASIRSEGVNDLAGNPPGSDPGPQEGPAEGGGNPVSGVPGSTELGREFSFSTAGGTERIFLSKETRYKVGETIGNEAKPAPDFGGLIGVPLGGGEIEGCEVYSAKCEFSVSQRLAILTVGYILRLMASTATTNKLPFYACARGEVLFLGGDGHYRDGSELPWSVNGRFAYSKNVAEKVVGNIHLVDIWGWNYLWFQYERRTETIVHLGQTIELEVQYPKHGYVERVYDETDFSVLNMELSGY